MQPFKEVPTDWAQIQLRRIVDLRTERVSEWTHEEYIGLENVEPWTGKVIKSKIAVPDSEEFITETTATKFEQGDILFGKLRPYLAKAFIASSDGICSTEFLVLRPRKHIYPPYLLYTLLSREYISRVDAETFGVKMPRANWESIGNLYIPLPSYTEQEKIADFLIRKTEKVENLIGGLSHLLDLLAEKRQALITHTVTHGLNPDVAVKDSGIEWIGEIPEHWETRNLKYVAKLAYGDALPPTDEERDGDVKVYGSNGPYERFSVANTSSPVIVVGRKGSYGKVNWSDDAVFASDTTFFIDYSTTSENLRWIYYALQILGLDQGTNEAAVPGLNRELAYSKRLPVPPQDEQENIADFLDVKTKLLDTLNEEIWKTIGLLQERRSALISAAVTGQIRVTE